MHHVRLDIIISLGISFLRISVEQRKTTTWGDLLCSILLGIQNQAIDQAS